MKSLVSTVTAASRKIFFHCSFSSARLLCIWFLQRSFFMLVLRFLIVHGLMLQRVVRFVLLSEICFPEWPKAGISSGCAETFCTVLEGK